VARDHDQIVAKQHGGSIEVDTRPGELSEIKVILPREGAFSLNARNRPDVRY
jgi:two-component system, NtrC family, sensor kinase